MGTKENISYVHISVAVVCNIILDLRSSMLRDKYDLKKRGKSLYFDKSKISEKNCFKSMNLSMFNRFSPSLKSIAKLEERVDLSKDNINEERYVIPMHRNIF
jgi:hypothetical protein